MCYLTTPQGELVTSMMLTDVGKKTDILVTGFNRIGCYVKMLVVGGGGQDGGPTKFGGAGSGNLQYLDAIPIETGTHIRAQVCSAEYCLHCEFKQLFSTAGALVVVTV